MTTTLGVRVATVLPHQTVAVTCAGRSFSVALPVGSHPFAALVKTVELQDKYLGLAEVASGSRKQVGSVPEFNQLKEQCLTFFGLKLQFDLEGLALQMLNEDQSKVLDQLSRDDLLSLCKKGYQSLPQQLHGKLSRRIKRYLNNSKDRPQKEKDQIKGLVELTRQESSQQEEVAGRKSSEGRQLVSKSKDNKKQYVEAAKSKSDKSDKKLSNGRMASKARQQAVEEEDEDDWEEVKEEKVEKVSRRKEKRMKKQMREELEEYQAGVFSAQLGKEADSEQADFKVSRKSKKEKKAVSSLFGSYKDKAKKDLRVALGLFGDIKEGWRERYRVERIPEFAKPKDKRDKPKPEVKPEGASAGVVSSQQQKVEAKEESPIKPRVVKMEASSKSLVKTFSFPQDGQNLLLDTGQEYRLRVNDSFWVMLKGQMVTIQKGDAGYIRVGKWSSSADYLLEAQDLTLSLSSPCNMEDGGQAFGKPAVSDFTGCDSQWFSLQSLEVYTYQ